MSLNHRNLKDFGKNHKKLAKDFEIYKKLLNLRHWALVVGCCESTLENRIKKMQIGSNIWELLLVFSPENLKSF